MSVFVSNLQEEVALDSELIDFLIPVIEEVLRGEGYGEEAEVSLVFVNDSYIRDLNLQYREIDSPTDVLSFSMLEGESFQEEWDAEVLLGDVVISLQAAVRQAEEYGHGIRREVAYLAIHGVLHLLGYDHLKEEDRQAMRKKEEEILLKLNAAR
ncbi:rRNA maturation RNase YbeY [Pelotomaculum terephthalicicum JT]|uniref:rRNA maturation RNase YbeY n=1 Tax=Pelotomaculum TaxID=191373 RepID=UPI0009CF82A1|nr:MULTISPECIES: rRNA maturation RNase YbeY [Pelotomaculum]MCG9967050.1 rRNA maturation RNase YbeY [Pelotomaculum terephthalicicum JT]OPX90503.1 MAG: Endoribonuclease YbeY [Pelotomaculum sp. PtaB.Bin117]OPY63905.1 MAG: Endoribonuclease YbeY [Pelotomaculum sp. PtaU1.Bin065]